MKRERKLIAQNRKAKFEYHLDDFCEAGIVLTGSEVKSLRVGQSNIAEAYAAEYKGELFLLNSHIAEYKGANRFNHEPKRPRKLLLHKKQINKLLGKLKVKGLTLVPISLYFNEKNIAKLEIAVGKGKKLYDKRASEKNQDWEREKGRMMRDKY